MNTNWLDYTLLTLVIIGAINWGLIGFFRFDLVAFLFGDMSWLSRIIYAIVGIGGLYLISLFGRGSWVPYCFSECFAYNETTIFAFATSVNLDSSLETLNTNFTLNFSLIASNFWIAWFNSSSE